MGALFKFFLSPIYSITSIYFSKVFPEVLRLMILSAFALYSCYKRRSSKSEYMAAINKNSSRFVYKRKLGFWPSSSVSSTRITTSECCSICLSEYREGEAARELLCGHVFHDGCLEKWLQGSWATCPLCRAPVVPEEIVSEHRRLQDDHQLLNSRVEEQLALMLISTTNLWDYHSSFF